MIHSERSRDLRLAVGTTAHAFGVGSTVHRLAEGMTTLVLEYIPTLFVLGCAVRECYWDLQDDDTGLRAREVLAFCLHVLLCLEKSERNEYCRVISMSLLTWAPVHSRLPAATFMEEVNEASLSRLTRFCNTDLRRRTVGDFSDAYASLGTGPALVDAVRPHFAVGLQWKILCRIDKYLVALRTGRVPTVSGTGVKGIRVYGAVKAVVVPPTPLHGVDEAKVERCLQHALYTMLVSDSIDEELLPILQNVCLYAPVPTSAEVADGNAEYDQVLDDLRNLLQRASSRRKATRPNSQPIPVGDDGDDVVQQLAADQAMSSSALQAIPVERRPTALSLDEAATDPDGVSDSAVPLSPLSVASSFTTDDSRSAACTSGEEDDAVDAD